MKRMTRIRTIQELLRVRKYARYSDLARDTGIDHARISRIASGTPPRTRAYRGREPEAVRLARALKVSVAKLMSFYTEDDT